MKRVYLHCAEVLHVVVDGGEQVLGHRQDVFLVVHQKRHQPGGQQLVQVALHGAAQDAARKRVDHLEGEEAISVRKWAEGDGRRWSGGQICDVVASRGPHQRPGADGRVEAGHVHVLADARHHPHEELQLPAGGGGEEQGAQLQRLHSHTLTVRLEEAYTHTVRH